MQHIMIDAYGVSKAKLNDIRYIYDALNSITYENDLTPIMPPSLIPYYYGSVKEDEGISAFVLLRGGHVTIHTFSYRECYFLDILYEDFIDIDSVKKVMDELFPASEIKVYETDRRQVLDVEERYAPNEDFGPHVIFECDLDRQLDMNMVFETLDLYPGEIGMHPISRPQVLFDNSREKNFISGITLIAESHISIHQNVKSKKVYIDIFSCKPFDLKVANKIVERINGKIVSSNLVIRGSKHNDIKSDDTQVQAKSGYWMKNSH